MEMLIIFVFSVALCAASALAFAKDSKILGVAFATLGVAGLGYLVYTHIQDIPVPDISITEMPWLLISGALAAALGVVGLLVEKPRVATLGLGFGVWFLYLALAPSVWFLVLGLIATLLILIHNGDGNRWLAALAAALVAATFVVGVQTSATINSVKDVYESIKAQLADNNKHFESYDQMCLAAQPGSEVALICGAINQNAADIADLKVKVDANTTAIATLTGQMATVTEKADDQQVVIQSDPSSDDAAAAALAQELAAAGWGPDNVSVNNVNEDGKIDQQGNNAFGSRIRTKAKLVEVLNGSSAQETAIRDRVMSQLPESERARALSGEGWYAIQFKQSLCISGSDWFKDGQSYNGDGHIDCHAAGDVYWVYVGTDGKIYWGAAVRDDCNNPHLDTAPAPQGTEQAEAVCPEDSARAGQMIGSGCNPGQPETPTGGTPESSTPGTTPSGSTPTTSTPSTSTTTTTTESCPYDAPRDENGNCTKTGGHNPAITQSEAHSVDETADGGSVSNGRQDDPAHDAEVAASSAAAAASSQSAAASSAASQADTDSGGGSDSHGQAPVTATAGAPTGSAGENTGGDVWDTTG